MSRKKKNIPEIAKESEQNVPWEELKTNAVGHLQDEIPWGPMPLNDFASLSAVERARILDRNVRQILEKTYIRFHQPVPRKVNETPVSEMKLVVKEGSITDQKYRVDKIVLTKDWAIITVDNETTTIPIATVHYARP